VKHRYRHELYTMYAFLCKRQRETSFPPSLREIADEFYLSPASVMRYLDKMEALGWLMREWGKARGITLIRECSIASNEDDENT
jgi:DNA-binding MarR family transcriptional regulator